MLHSVGLYSEHMPCTAHIWKGICNKYFQTWGIYVNYVIITHWRCDLWIHSVSYYARF